MGGGKGGRTRSGRRRKSEMVEKCCANKEMSEEVTTRFLSFFAGQATQASIEDCVPCEAFGWEKRARGI